MARICCWRKVDKEDIIRYYRDTDWEKFYEEIKKEVER